MSSALLPPLIPENAPFSPEQRSWLNGFFAGLVGMMPNMNGGPGQFYSGDGAQLFAGTNGTTNGIGTSGSATAVAEVEEEFPWHDASLPLDERMQLAEGKPPARRLMAAMAQLNCGACGYLCQTYSEAIATGMESDLTRCSPGGTETAKKLKELVSLEKLQASAATIASPNGYSNGHANGHANGKAIPSANGNGKAVPAASQYSRVNPYPAKIAAVTPLNHRDSAKDTRQVVIDLGESGLEYLPGDSLGVMPQNCPEFVDLILNRLQTSGNEMVTLADGTTLSGREALITRFALNKVTDGLVGLLANHATKQKQAQELRELSATDPDEYLLSADLLDVLMRFPTIEIGLAELVGGAPPLSARLYSIASSLRKHPREVHLTIGVVRYSLRERHRKGVCSTYLADRVSCGHTVPVFVQQSHGFRLPADPGAPVIMVGPGTGIAPFLAFLEERQATGANGKNWLFFGDQRADYDFLYREELTEYQRGGLLSRIDTAFSRDQAGKVYVQDRMREQAAQLWHWLQEGANFYVCGDAKRMAPDVDVALVDAVAQQSGKSLDDAKTYVRQMTKEKRYLRDVY